MVTEGAFFMHFVGNESINARGSNHTAFISPVTVRAQGWVNHELLTSLSILGQPAHLHSTTGFPTSQLVSRRDSAIEDLHRAELEFTRAHCLHTGDTLLETSASARREGQNTRLFAVHLVTVSPGQADGQETTWLPNH